MSINDHFLLNLEYIVTCYGALHTTGPQYIIEDINGLIEERRQKINETGACHEV